MYNCLIFIVWPLNLGFASYACRGTLTLIQSQYFTGFYDLTAFDLQGQWPVGRKTSRVSFLSCSLIYKLDECLATLWPRPSICPSLRVVSGGQGGLRTHFRTQQSWHRHFCGFEKAGSDLVLPSWSL